MTRYFELSLKKSFHGRPLAQRLILEGLGLRKIHKSVILKDTPTARGIIFKISHLLTVKVLDEAAVKSKGVC